MKKYTTLALFTAASLVAMVITHRIGNSIDWVLLWQSSQEGPVSHTLEEAIAADTLPVLWPTSEYDVGP